MVGSLAVASMLVAGPALPASAGANGQQLAFVPSCTASWVYIQGYNQNNQWTTQWFSTPPAVPENGCQGPLEYDWGSWWKGQVRVDGYWGRQGQYRSTVFVQVPQSQSNSDWVVVGVPG
jgi:hypothetical protein